MSERMEVEVCCDNWEPDDFGWVYCGGCESDGPRHKALRKFVAPGTRTEALLRLAEAAVAVADSDVRMPVESLDTHEKQKAWLAFADRAAALRAFDQGEGKDAAD